MSSATGARPFTALTYVRSYLRRPRTPLTVVPLARCRASSSRTAPLFAWVCGAVQIRLQQLSPEAPPAASQPLRRTSVHDKQAACTVQSFRSRNVVHTARRRDATLCAVCAVFSHWKLCRAPDSLLDAFVRRTARVSTPEQRRRHRVAAPHRLAAATRNRTVILVLTELACHRCVAGSACSMDGANARARVPMRSQGSIITTGAKVVTQGERRQQVVPTTAASPGRRRPP